MKHNHAELINEIKSPLIEQLSDRNCIQICIDKMYTIR